MIDESEKLFTVNESQIISSINESQILSRTENFPEYTNDSSDLIIQESLLGSFSVYKLLNLTDSTYVVYPEINLCYDEINKTETCNIISDQKFEFSHEMMINNISYVLYHNGTEGIQDVKLKIKLINITETNIKKLRTYFSVTFKWHKTNKKNDSRKDSSGKYGYSIGDPLLIGQVQRDKEGNGH